MQQLDTIKKSEIMGFIGEVFYSEMLTLLNDTSEKKIWIKPHGMNSRVLSKDIIDISNYSYVVNDDIKEAIFVHLSRNSIYHQLPESFFHPLAISTPNMSKAEVVDAIRKNRQVEEDNIKFFIPFDTQLFEKRVQLTNRYINIFTDKNSRKVLFSLAQKIIAKEIPITKEQYYKLFLNLCNGESYKENLPAIQNLLQRIMGYKVELEYVEHVHSSSPFQPLGSGTLGYTFGTQGKVCCEFDDIAATIIVEEEMNYKTIRKDMKAVQSILEYFVFSNREIIVKVQTTFNTAVVLGDNHLGYNTILAAS